MQATVEKVWLSYEEARERTGLSTTTLWRGIKDGKLKKSGHSRGIKFHRDDLDRFMRSRN